jgi:hypothetical protein
VRSRSPLTSNSTWERAAKNNGVVVAGDLEDKKKYKFYHATDSPADAAAFQRIGNATHGLKATSDIDFCDMPDGTARFIYSIGNQAGTQFNQVGTFDGTVNEYLAAQF